ncbi:MAG: ABC transporter permease subunit [Planctomycetota bacterium]
MTVQSFTGRPRRRRTRRGVLVTERIARLLISAGGIGTILAVSLICLFLVWVVVPLFLGADVTRDGSPTPIATGARAIRACGADEYRRLAWALYDDATVEAYRLDGGVLVTRKLEATPTAVAASQAEDGIALGFADGSVRVARIGFETEVFDVASQPELAAAVSTAVIAAVGESLVERLDPTTLRVQRLVVALEPPIDVGGGAPIRRLDRSQRGATNLIAALRDDGKLILEAVERRENLLTGEVRLETQRGEIDVARPGLPPPEHLLLAGGGETLYLAWPDGICRRYDTRDFEQPALAQEVDLVPGDATLASLAFVIGKTTLVSGDTEGRIGAWFPHKPLGAVTRDGALLVRAHELSTEGAPIRVLAASQRSRVIAAVRAPSTVEIYHVTSHKLLASLELASSGPVTALAFGPKEDGLVAFTPSALASVGLELGHPEAGLDTLFAPVWYEGYEAPTHTWQSASGTDDFEPKLGLMPLVFGTLKATVYSMLFAVPLALLAALFTSEFLDPRLRAPLKSLTEMMASLPSVVLGFLAAIVIAPLVQGFVPAVLCAFVTMPAALLFGAHLWQLLPQEYAVRASNVPRFLAIAVALPVGAFAAWALAPFAERVLFAGDLMGWLDGQHGSALGGWILLLLPLSAIGLAWMSSRVLAPYMRTVSNGWTRGARARFDLVKFAVGAAGTIALAAACGWVLEALGLDPRGEVLGTYEQRNSMIVGFVMGFAVIPIIYTLAEDALASVPSHLRLASLGAGATPWQTAVRVVVPTAMSGLFSAVMIGLGRAVGETMIVLMAAGNTAVMNWNVFNGFRTLSANIATELPEAVENSTHYRTLFLAALCLFAITFAFNTVAEVVRQRFRKRAFQL